MRRHIGGALSFMSEQKPRMWPAAAVAGLLLVAGLAMISIGAFRLSTASIGLALVIWLVLPLAGLPLALWSAYHLYGLLTASYRIDRDGFYLRWGLASEQAPISQVLSVGLVSAEKLSAPTGLRMPGFLLGASARPATDHEFFGVTAQNLVLVELERTQLIITPNDPEAFVGAFESATKLGSLDPSEASSERSNLLTTRLWQDQWARYLMLAGFSLPLALIAYLGFRSGQLPAQVPFGFEATGAPGPAAPLGRLLLLALVNGLVWVINLLAGAWFYPQEGRRPLSYSLWALSLLIGGLFWGAVIQMLGAAQ